MRSSEKQRLLLAINFFIFVVKSEALSEEGCYQYRRKANVTMDTDQCLWQNYTQPQLKTLCLASCFKNDAVSTIRLKQNQRDSNLASTMIEYTEPKPEGFCLKSCCSNDTVRAVKLNQDQRDSDSCPIHDGI